MNEKELSSAKTETEKPSYWGVLPAEVRYCPGLPAAAKVLYTEISALTQMDGICVKDNAYFCELYKISERTLQGHLKALAQQGFIAILDGDGGQGRRRIYAGINPLAHNPAKNCGVPVNPAENCGVTPQKTAGTYKDIQDLSQDPPIAPQGAEAKIWDEPAWERFWAMYPRKVDKAKAIRAWNRLKADRKLMQTMSAALKAQKASEEWRRDNGRAIPYPSTWLNNRRWEDELEEAPDYGAGEIPAASGSEEALPWI